MKDAPAAYQFQNIVAAARLPDGDPDGTWLGRVDTPRGFTVLRITGDEVLGVQRDSLDVQHFQVLRINP